jgi:hypothetical protein
MQTRALLLLGCVLSTAAPVVAKVAAVDLAAMVEASDLIGLAEVTAVRRTLLGKRVAKAEFIENWKGRAATAEFVASPSWACDIAEATVGETVVLFLARLRERDRHQIVVAGRGRMPVRDATVGRLADVWPEVLLPEDTPTYDGPEPEYRFIRSIRLRDLEALVAAHLEDP